MVAADPGKSPWKASQGQQPVTRLSAGPTGLKAQGWTGHLPSDLLATGQGGTDSEDPTSHADTAHTYRVTMNEAEVHWLMAPEAEPGISAQTSNLSLIGMELSPPRKDGPKLSIRSMSSATADTGQNAAGLFARADADCRW